MNVIADKTNMQECFDFLKQRAEENPLCSVLYLKIGVNVIRVLCYTEKIISILKKQLDYVLYDSVDHYDSTVIIWEDCRIEEITNKVTSMLPLDERLKLRVETLCCKQERSTIRLIEKENITAVFSVNGDEKLVEAFDDTRRECYFSVSNFNLEIFVRQGHALVRTFNWIVKSPTVNLTHGAVFGYDGNGFLLCGRGRRGKSTLTVESMLQGFEYVSDDYQIIQQTDRGLLSYPIYSIITLSHRMYNEMYDRFEGKFICNNFLQEKYLFNISCYHDQFRTAYPVRFCLFPEITMARKPSIIKCTNEEKGRAIVQLVHSTVSQMNDMWDVETIHKLLHMLKPMPFYKFYLGENIIKNTELLREFVKKEDTALQDVGELKPLLLDITFGLATIIDTRDARIFEMNKFSTNIFILIQKKGKAIVKEIRKILSQYTASNADILMELTVFTRVIEEKNFSELDLSQYDEVEFNYEFADSANYRLSVREYVDNRIEELVKI